MNTRLTNTLEMLDRAADFGTTEGLPANARATSLFTQVKTIADAMRTAAEDQATGEGRTHGGCSDRLRTATTLRKQVHGVVKVARVMDPVAFPAATEMRGPRSSSYQALLASARSILANVATVKAAMVERGMLADFDETMGTLIDDLDAATRRKSNGLGLQVAGTAGLTEQATRGKALVKELDAIMTHVLQDLPSLMASWKTAARIRRDRTAAAPAAHAPGSAPAGTTTGGTSTSH
jgi:hypothetical protein